jgi:leucyl aminopeptidase
VTADVLVLPAFEGPEPGPGVRELKAIDLMSVAKDASFKGKRGESLSVPTLGKLGSGTVVLLGLGKKADVDANTLRRVIGGVASGLAKRATVATTLPQAVKDVADGSQATAEGLLLGSYRFDRYRSGKSKIGPEKRALRSLTVLGTARWDERAVKAALKRAGIVADAVCWARDLVNTPALDMPPATIAEEAQKMARRHGLQCKIWRKADLEKGGMGGILGVGQGSSREPRMIELRYTGAGSAPAIAISGKGIAFDSGGLSLKDSKNMEWMKGDMGGAAAMLAVMKAIAQLKPKVNVIAAIPSAENMPGGSAIRPGDILTHRNGKTSEVLNTDAEGRLVLADALSYLAEKKPRVIVDCATLTGACVVALGEDIYGAIGNDRRLIEDVLAAGRAVGEPGWELPLWQDYHQHIEAPNADVQNVGNRWGGAITASLFLEEFVGGVPWVHLDVAGPAFLERGNGFSPKGGTGVPARTVIRYILDQAEQDGRTKRR